MWMLNDLYADGYERDDAYLNELMGVKYDISV